MITDPNIPEDLNFHAVHGSENHGEHDLFSCDMYVITLMCIYIALKHVLA